MNCDFTDFPSPPTPPPVYKKWNLSSELDSFFVGVGKAEMS